METQILNQILDQLKQNNTAIQNMQQDVSGLKTDVAGLKIDVAGLKTDVAELKVGQARLESKMDIVFEQIAHFMDLKKEMNENLQDIKNELLYITHRSVENEKELIQIKSHLKIIK